MNDDDSRDLYKVVSAFDVSDDNPAALARRLHAIQRDMHAGFDSIGQALQALTRIEERLHVVIDRQNHSDIRQDRADQRMDALDKRLAALEAPITVTVETPHSAHDAIAALPRATAIRKRRSPRKKK
jgi:Mg-chelatase subunit ChlI